jgi:hypothetical protein
LNEIQKIINENIVDINSEKNAYFCPQLFSLLMNEIHLLPLWSGVMIYKVQMFYNDLFPEIKTRLTNNFVEYSFGHIKKIFYRNKRNSLQMNWLAIYIMMFRDY